MLLPRARVRHVRLHPGSMCVCASDEMNKHVCVEMLGGANTSGFGSACLLCRWDEVNDFATLSA